MTDCAGLGAPGVHLLEDLPPRGAGSIGLELIRLILSQRARAAEQARAVAKAAPEPDRKWVLDWRETILVYKLPQLTREEIRMILELQDVDLKQSRFYQEVFAEGRDNGLVEGREEGREEGRKSEAVDLVLRQLGRRLGALPHGTAADIAALPPEQVERLGEDLLDCTGPDDLTAWLRRA